MKIAWTEHDPDDTPPHCPRRGTDVAMHLQGRRHMSLPPKGCTCLWTNHSRGGSVYIADPDCPALPHPRTWQAEP